MLPPSHHAWFELQSALYDGPTGSLPGSTVGEDARGRAAAQGHFTRGGMELRIDWTLPPVRRPKVVPRS